MRALITFSIPGKLTRGSPADPATMFPSGSMMAIVGHHCAL
jgi:hypothetical protein